MFFCSSFLWWMNIGRNQRDPTLRNARYYRRKLKWWRIRKKSHKFQLFEQLKSYNPNIFYLFSTIDSIRNFSYCIIIVYETSDLVNHFNPNFRNIKLEQNGFDDYENTVYQSTCLCLISSFSHTLAVVLSIVLAVQPYSVWIAALNQIIPRKGSIRRKRNQLQKSTVNYNAPN